MAEYIRAGDILPLKIYIEPTVNTPVNTGGGNTQFYIDGYSLVGSGTQADPIRATDSINWISFLSGEFVNADNRVLIDWTQPGGVWFDGLTLTCAVYDGTGNNYNYPITYYQNIYAAFPVNPGGAFRVDRFIPDASDIVIIQSGVVSRYTGDDYFNLIEIPVQGNTAYTIIGLMNIYSPNSET